MPTKERYSRVEHVAVHRVAADRVRPVEDDHALPLPRAGLHHVEHRVDERVVARADVLHVEDHRVDAGEHLRGGDAGLAVEAVDRQPRLAVARVAHLDEVLRVGGDAVLGPEEGRELHAAPGREGDRGVLEVRRDRGGVDDEADAEAPDRLRPVEELLEPRADAGHGVYSTKRRVKLAGGLPARSTVPVTVFPSSVPLKWYAVPCWSTVKRTLPRSNPMSRTGALSSTPPRQVVSVPASRPPSDRSCRLEAGGCRGRGPRSSRPSGPRPRPRPAPPRPRRRAPSAAGSPPCPRASGAPGSRARRRRPASGGWPRRRSRSGPCPAGRRRPS